MDTNHAARDKEARVAFYVLLWKRQGLSLELFDDYWRDVHGPVCARLPGQFQYWQFHVAHNSGGILPPVRGVADTSASEDQFDGIAELTFKSAQDRQTWFTAAGILMDDEQNIFSKAIGYVTEEGQSVTYVDRIEVGDPNGGQDILKYHVMVRQAPGAAVADFRRYLSDSFASNVLRRKELAKFRLHLFEPPDVSRPDAAGVAHSEAPEKQYQAAFELAFLNKADMEAFFASREYAAAVAEQSNYVSQVCAFPERNAYTFVYDGQMTLSGQRGSRTAELIASLGAGNQLKDDIRQLIVSGGAGGAASAAGSELAELFAAHAAGLPGASEGRTNYYKDLAADYSTPTPLPQPQGDALIALAEQMLSAKEPALPDIGPGYTLGQIERENKEWWPTHCEALRRGRGDLLTAEYHNDLIYFCQDGPYYGLDQQKPRELHWWALIAQPGVTMTWPIVMFHGEFVWFEWACLDDRTKETIAKGSVSWVRRGHRGGCYFKGEQLTFYRDVFASDRLLKLITT